MRLFPINRNRVPMGSYYQFLKDIQFFKSLPDSEISRIEEVCREERFQQGDVIFSEGAMGDRCFIILEGAVEIWKNYLSPERDLLAVYTRPQLFGELALIDHFPRSATVIARDSVRLLSIRGDDFNRVISKSGPISTSIMKSVSSMLREQTDRFIQELRESKQHLEKAYERLLKEVKERKQLEMQLLQAQKMESIGTLAGGIAHDFNNILFPIMGYSEMTMDLLPEGSPMRRNMEEILRAADRARELVRQILTFSRQAKQERKPLKIQPIIKETLKLLRASLPAKIRIREFIDEEARYIKADPSQIHQVLMNLCTNAFHAMEEKGGTLKVILDTVQVDDENSQLTPVMFPGPYLKLTVEDTGCGMTHEIRERIFDPYFTTKEVGKGTGLGLAIVHGIIKAHDGYIHVSSEPEKGSAFDIFLPIVENIEIISSIHFEKNAPKGNERILLVEDELQIVRMLQMMLQDLGYQVKSRTSSVEALCAFQAVPNAFDLVITDHNMPNMTGDELSREIIRIRPDIPVILCTGFSDNISEQKLKASGIRKLVMKPVVRNEIAHVIREALDNPAP